MGAIYATPRVPGEFIARPRLTKRLNADVPLVVLRGAAGSGKTVLAAQWAGHAGPGVWVSVDDESSKRLVFWRHIIETLCDAGLLAENSLLGASARSLDAIPDLRRFLVRGFAAVPEDCTIVIDDYERLTEADASVDDDIVALLRGGARMRILVVTRRLGGLESDAVRVALAPEVIAPHDMPFTASEIAEVVARAGIEDPDGLTTATLWDALDGLPVAVRGAIVALQSDAVKDVDGSLSRGLAQVVARLQEDTAHTFVPGSEELAFAMRTSVADPFSIDLARALSGHDDAEDFLRQAEGAGLGLWTRTPEGAFFSYTPVIRNALRRVLARDLPDEIPALEGVTARWAFDHERWASAFRHAVQGGDLDFAAEALLQDWLTLVSFYGPGIEELLTARPLEELRRHPVLAMALALYDNQSGRNRQRMGRLFTTAVAAARAQERAASPERLALLLAIEGSALRIAGFFEEAMVPAERMLEAVHGLRPAERARLRRVLPTMLAQTGITLYCAGKHNRALALFESAYEASEGVSPAGRLHAFALASGIRAWAGQMVEASVLAAQARERPWPEGWRDGYIGALYHLAEAFLGIESGDNAAAQRHIDVLGPHMETFEHWWLFLFAQSLIDLAEGRAVARAAALQQLMAPGVRAAVSPHARARLQSTRAILLGASGRLDEAFAALEGARPDVPAAATGLARLHLAAGEPQRALDALAPLAQEDESSTVRLWSEVLLMRAAARLRLGDEHRAVDAFFRGLTGMREHGLRTPFTLLPTRDRTRLAAVARRTGMGSADEEFLDGLVALPGLWADADAPVSLTEREAVVLGHLTRTGSAHEIAEALYVSANTVKSQLRSLYRKLGVRSREDALLVARERGLLG